MPDSSAFPPFHAGTIVFVPECCCIDLAEPGMLSSRLAAGSLVSAFGGGIRKEWESRSPLWSSQSGWRSQTKLGNFHKGKEAVPALGAGLTGRADLTPAVSAGTTRRGCVIEFINKLGRPLNIIRLQSNQKV